MCEDFSGIDTGYARTVLKRRSFVTLAGAGAGALMAALPARAMLGGAIASRDVSVAAPDGMIDGYFVAPATGTHPGILMWPDIRGLRPAFRSLADRLASDGYAVLCVNPFYRWQTAAEITATSDWSDPSVRERQIGYLRQLNRPEATRDASALIPFLDAQPDVDSGRKLGTTGYCLGGPMTIWTAMSDRIGAAASFHGSKVGTDQEDSPHLLIASTGAGYLFAIAEDDDAQEPEEKNRLIAVLRNRPQWHEVEVYQGAMHSWCIPDSLAYNEAAANKAWSRMIDLFKACL